MYLSFTTRSPEGQTQHHHNLDLEDLEVALEVLNLYVKEGYHLLTAWVLEDEARIMLPPEAFDGYPIREPLGRLQQQWQQILA